MKRGTTLLVIGLVGVAGCQNLGLDGNIPLDEARGMAPSELVAAVHRAIETDEALVMDARLWVPWGLPVEIQDRYLRSVGSTRGHTLFARSWDRAPFDALFADEDGHWQGYAPVIGRAGEAGGGPEH